MALDPNVFLGEIMNSPIFWVMLVIIGFMGIGFYFGWFGKLKRGKKYESEDLNESLMKDIKPRIKMMGKKLKDTKLMQNVNSFGKVRKYTEGKFEYHARISIPDNPGHKNPGEEDIKFEVEEVDVIYFTVGGNKWLDWIPYIGKKYEPEYFVINKKFVKHDPQSRIFDIKPGVHIYPYAKIWISGKKTQDYLTELEARRTQEFEAETNINTLKRWTYYNEPQSGRVVVMEKDADIESEKWESSKDRGSDM